MEITRIPTLNLHIRKNGDRYGYRISGTQQDSQTGEWKEYNGGWHNMKRLAPKPYADRGDNLTSRVMAILYNATGHYVCHVINETNEPYLEAYLETWRKYNKEKGI